MLLLHTLVKAVIEDIAKTAKIIFSLKSGIENDSKAFSKLPTIRIFFLSPRSATFPANGENIMYGMILAAETILVAIAVP